MTLEYRIRANTVAAGLFLLVSIGITADAPAADRDHDFFVISSIQFTVLHELGHVVLTELEPPFLGGEEDAADQLATVAMLLPRGDTRDPQATEKLIAAAEAWRIEWELHQALGYELDYWDNHPLDIQRYYTIACLLYGGTPQASPGLEARLQLHYQRAWRCEDDYRRVLRSLRWIQESQGATGHTLRRTHARVGVIYEPPATPERARLYALVRKSGVLEQTARMIEAHFALPRDTNIVLANICGQTAYWRKDLQEVILCYALVERFSRMASLRPCLGTRVSVTEREHLPHVDEVRRCVAAGAEGIDSP